MLRLYEKIFDLKFAGDNLKSESPHLSGAFKEGRLFGGQCIAQLYLAARKFRPELTPLRMDVTFYGAGNTTAPIEYAVTSNNLEHSSIECRQNGKLLNAANFRYGTKDEFLKQRMIKFPENLPPPAECPTVKAMLGEGYIDQWMREFGTTYQIRKTGGIFDVRPIDFYAFGGQTLSHEPQMVWLKLKDELKSVEIIDPLVMPLLISDYLVGLSVTRVLDQRRILTKTMASMTHKAVFHSNEFDYGELIEYEKRMPKNLLDPQKYPTVADCHRNGYLDKWLRNFGSALNLGLMDERNELFEIRPIDFSQFSGMDSDSTPTIQCWIRLADSLQSMVLEDSMLAPIMVSDFLAFQSGIVALDCRHLRLLSSASLNHRIVIHRTSGFDPKGFFLMEGKLETLNGTGLYYGRVFDSGGRCILSFQQLNYLIVDSKI